MGKAELDPSHVLAFMVVGGVCVAFALYLLVRPPHHGSTRIEMFGMKFEASSAAILVFLAGLALLLSPVWSDERAPAAATPEPPPERAGTAPGAGGAQPGTNVALTLPADPAVEEAEPNARVQDANQLSVGQTVSGAVGRDDVDFYVVPTAGREGQRMWANLRMLTDGGIRVELLDHNEVRLAYDVAWEPEMVRLSAPVSGDRAFLRVTRHGSGLSTDRYELFLSTEEF